MAAWVKMVAAVLVVLMPGGFLVALAYALFRVLREGRRAAQLRAPGQVVTLRALLAEVHLREVVRLARLP